jgi:hypothetical protein
MMEDVAPNQEDLIPSLNDVSLSPNLLANPLSWATLLDVVQADPTQVTACASFVTTAGTLARQPIIQRARRLAEVGRNRTWLDHRSDVLDDVEREHFALAMSDMDANRTLADELPSLAAGYRLTGEPIFHDRVLAQLAEMSSWTPLQRPGWTCYERGCHLPPDGKDGAWLATGTGVRAIADCLELMPPDSIPAALHARLMRILKAEAAQVVEDWKVKRTWFSKRDDTRTNQWVLPTEGLVRACLVLGVEHHREAYELGVANLLRSLDDFGPDGEMDEGSGYGLLTVESLMAAARAMGMAGDRRALDHPFLTRFVVWQVHHLQPAHMKINCFDSGGGLVLRDDKEFRRFLAMAIISTGHPVAAWALLNQFDGPPANLQGLACRARLGELDSSAAPPLFAAYRRGARVNWRSHWDDDATGVWVRGGAEWEGHDHADRGHVNWIHRGRPILIEAGTPAYHTTNMAQNYASVRGHNVLQAGAVPVKKGLAPIFVHRLNALGGDVRVDASHSYPNVARWLRRVDWDADSLRIEDEVTVADGKRERIEFCWHLGTEEAVTIQGSAAQWTVRWPEAVLTVNGSTPLVLEQELRPDNTLRQRDWDDTAPEHHHTCLRVRSVMAIPHLELTTEIR